MNEPYRTLTFEWNEKQDMLEIHGNSKGLEELAKVLNKLANTPGIDHDHLMTQTWGGEELSEDQMSPDTKLINHVKIYKWE